MTKSNIVNKDIYIDSTTGYVNVNMDIILSKTILLDSDMIRVQTTGHDYDFIATVENKSKEAVLIVFDDESDYLPEITIEAEDWVGLLANDEGYEILEALTNNRFHFSEDIK